MAFDRIHIDPAVCNGKPTIRGLRFTVDFVLKLLGEAQVVIDTPHASEPSREHAHPLPAPRLCGDDRVSLRIPAWLQAIRRIEYTRLDGVLDLSSQRIASLVIQA